MRATTMKTKASEIKIERTSRQVIENKLLDALNNSECVAILASEEDLRIMIDGLVALGPFHTKARHMAEDYGRLLNSAFPKRSR